MFVVLCRYFLCVSVFSVYVCRSVQCVLFCVCCFVFYVKVLSALCSCVFGVWWCACWCVCVCVGGVCWSACVCVCWCVCVVSVVFAFVWRVHG